MEYKFEIKIFLETSWIIYDLFLELLLLLYSESEFCILLTKKAMNCHIRMYSLMRHHK